MSAETVEEHPAKANARMCEKDVAILLIEHGLPILLKSSLCSLAEQHGRITSRISTDTDWKVMLNDTSTRRVCPAVTSIAAIF